MTKWLARLFGVALEGLEARIRASERRLDTLENDLEHLEHLEGKLRGRLTGGLRRAKAQTNGDQDVPDVAAINERIREGRYTR